MDGQQGSRSASPNPDARAPLAAIPNRIRSGDVTFRNNVMSTYNDSTPRCEAAQGIVWASSETTLGLPFGPSTRPPTLHRREHPMRPESAYSSQGPCEEMAARYTGGTLKQASGQRQTNLMEPKDTSVSQLASTTRTSGVEPVGLYRCARLRQAYARLSRWSSPAPTISTSPMPTRSWKRQRELMRNVFPDVP